MQDSQSPITATVPGGDLDNLARPKSCNWSKLLRSPELFSRGGHPKFKLAEWLGEPTWGDRIIRRVDPDKRHNLATAPVPPRTGAVSFFAVETAKTRK